MTKTRSALQTRTTWLWMAGLLLAQACGGGTTPPDNDGGMDARVDGDGGGGDCPAGSTRPAFTSTAVTAAQVGASYSYMADASGSPAAAFSLVSGPSWLTVSAAGLVSGTPTAAGSFDVRIRAANCVGPADQMYSLVVSANNGDGGVDGGSDGGDSGPVAIQITSQDSAAGVVNNTFTFTATASQSDVTWSATGLPSWATLDASTGVISGIPDAAAVSTVMLTAARAGSTSGMQTLTITVTAAAQPPTINSDAPSDLTLRVGEAFSYTATAASTSDVTWSLINAAGNCPVAPSISIDANSGAIAWTPEATGSCTIEIRATNTVGNSNPNLSFTLTIGDVPMIAPVDDSTVVVALGGAGTAYNTTLMATPAGTFAATNLPSSATLDMNSGAIAFTISPAGSVGSEDFTFEVTATNEFGTSSPEQFTVTVNTVEVSAASVTSSPSLSIVTGQTYTYNAEATGFPLPISWSLTGSPPSGMTVTPDGDGLTATVSWTAGAPGAYTIDLTVDNPDTFGATAANTQSFVLNVFAIPPAPVVDTSTAPAATNLINQAFSYDANLTVGSDVAIDGSAGAPVEWTLENAPAGMTINGSNGQVSWTPDALGNFNYTVRATRTDYPGLTGSATFALQVNPQPAAPVFTTTAPTVAVLVAGVDSAPSYTPAASGVPGFPPGTIVASGLPSWMTFDGTAPADCASESFTAGTAAGCSVIPVTEAGQTYNVTFTADNGTGMATQNWSFQVIQPPPTVSSIVPGAARRQVDVPVTIRGLSFSTVPGAISAVGIRLGGGSIIPMNNLVVVNSQTLTATLPADLGRTAGVYDVVVTQSGQNYVLTKRLNVTSSANSTVPATIDFPFTMTVAGSPWVVNGVTAVQGGGALTIEAGATVMFQTAASRIDVGVASGGNLIANGGAPGTGDQIVFTWLQPTAGAVTYSNFDGIRFGANSGAASLRNVVLELAGAAGGINGALELQNNATIASFSDSIIRDSIQTGLYLGQGAGLFTTPAWFDGNLLTRVGSGANQFPISTHADAAGTLGSNLTFAANAVSRIQLRTQDISRGDANGRSFLRRYSGIDYVTNGDLRVTNNITLNIEPGNTIRFPANSGLLVGSGTAAGLTIDAASSPVTLTADNPAQPSRGIYFGQNALLSVVRGAVISDFDNDWAAGLRFIDPTAGVDAAGTPLITIDQVSINTATAATRGVYLDANVRLAGFSNNTINVTDVSVDARADDVHTALSSSGSYSTRVNVRASNIDLVRNPLNTTSWARIRDAVGGTQAIRSTGTLSVVNTTLQLQPGAILELPQNAELRAWDGGANSGTLILNGTSTDRIVIRSIAPMTAAGKWGRVLFYGQLAAASQMSFVDLSDGGYVNAGGGNVPYASTDGFRGSLSIGCINPTNCAAPSVQNINITRSNHMGIYIGDGGSCPGCTANTVTGSVYAPLEVNANDAGFIGSGNSFTGNNTSGTANHNGVRIRAAVILRSQTWPALSASDSAPYYFVTGNTNIRGQSGTSASLLTIAAGTQVRFATNTGLFVGDVVSGYSLGGNLVLAGTSGNPVVLTNAADSTTNWWRGVYYYPDSTSASTASFATIRFGGSSNANEGNVNILVTGGIGGRPVFDNVTLDNSQRFAGYVQASITNPALRPAFTNMTYTNNPSGNCMNQAYAGGMCVAGPSYP